MFLLWQWCKYNTCNCTPTGVRASCPIELSPPSVVVRYGDPVSVNCSTSESLFEGIGWEATQGGSGLKQVNHLTWTVKNLTDFSISPTCFISLSNNSQFEQCFMTLKVVLYSKSFVFSVFAQNRWILWLCLITSTFSPEFPQTISISSSSGNDGVLKEMEEHTFTCDIHNIAPVQNLTVRWYKGDTIVYIDTFDNPSREPVDQTSVLRFIPTRQDTGVTFRCEAHLDLGPEGPQLNVSSQEYNITVHCKYIMTSSEMPNIWQFLFYKL